ncbi:MAG: hypothetical protein RIS35_2464 [Pseudomonadota bacterium]|jgi:hypothetical protein
MTTETRAAAIDEAIANANAHLNNVGLPSYNEVLEMLFRAQSLGLRFERGTAYIRRQYIDIQDPLNAKIDALRDQMRVD